MVFVDVPRNWRSDYTEPGHAVNYLVIFDHGDTLLIKPYIDDELVQRAQESFDE